MKSETRRAQGLLPRILGHLPRKRQCGWAIRGGAAGPAQNTRTRRPGVGRVAEREYEGVATTLTEQKTPITVAHGDGIGPEIMAATLQILEAAGARLEIETIEIGEKVYLRGNTAGIDPSSWDSLRRTKVFLKAPITTPQGGGFKSLNVTTRKTLGLYANVRPCVSYHPFVDTKHPEHGRGDRARKRRGSLRAASSISQPRSDAVPQAHLAPGHAKRSSATPSNTRARTTARRSPASPKTTS